MVIWLFVILQLSRPQTQGSGLWGLNGTFNKSVTKISWLLSSENTVSGIEFEGKFSHYRQWKKVGTFSFRIPEKRSMARNFLVTSEGNKSIAYGRENLLRDNNSTVFFFFYST